MSITYFASNKILDASFGNVALSMPATWYVGLSLADPGNSGSGVVEPLVSGSYARVAVTNNKSNFSNSLNGVVTNLGNIAFPESGSAWGTVTTVCFWDSLTSGSMWHYQNLTSPKVVQENTIISFSASTIVLSMTN
jgi:hypothetical protein